MLQMRSVTALMTCSCAGKEYRGSRYANNCGCEFLAVYYSREIKGMESVYLYRDTGGRSPGLGRLMCAIAYVERHENRLCANTITFSYLAALPSKETRRSQDN